MPLRRSFLAADFELHSSCRLVLLKLHSLLPSLNTQTVGDERPARVMFKVAEVQYTSRKEEERLRHGGMNQFIHLTSFKLTKYE